MKRSHLLSIGSISSATLRMADLIPSLLWDLQRIHLTRSERATVRAIVARADADDDGSYFDSEDADFDWQELTTIADNHVPDYCYFGSTEGDGAEIGVWPTVPDSFDDQVYRSAGLPGEERAPAGYARRTWAHTYNDQPYWLHVNDHGNATLYRRAGRRWIEVWAVV